MQEEKRPQEISTCSLKLSPRGKNCPQDFDLFILTQFSPFPSPTRSTLKIDQQQQFQTKDSEDVETTHRHKSLHTYTHTNTALSVTTLYLADVRLLGAAMQHGPLTPISPDPIQNDEQNNPNPCPSLPPQQKRKLSV